jgi:hypothetical protein
MRSGIPQGLSRETEMLSVDSGQMSIFDDQASEDYYDECCRKSNQEGGGIVQNCGFVTDTGDGDGGYRAHIWKDQKGNIVAVKVRFYLPSEWETD